MHLYDAFLCYFNYFILFLNSQTILFFNNSDYLLLTIESVIEFPHI